MGHLRDNPAHHCYTISLWLTRCISASFNLTFSGLPNPNLGGRAMTGATPMSGAAYGIMVEFTENNACLPPTIYIFHDDGVSLDVNGIPVGHFTSGPGGFLESASWTGPSCGNTVSLLYANIASAGGNGAWIEFFPQL